MCYSAQVVSHWREYVRRTGAEIDVHQFLEIFGTRAQGDSVRIPRGLDRAFLQSDEPEHREIRDLIDSYNRATITKFERDLFPQKKRLADAERNCR